MIQAVGDDRTGKSLGDGLIRGRIAVDDQTAVGGQQLGKPAEGLPDMVDVPEKIQMICIHIEDDADLREKTQETVGVLTGLRDKIAGLANPDVPADRGQDAAHGDGGVTAAFQQDVGDHGCGRGLAVGAGDGDGHLIIGHDLPQEFGAGQHGDSIFHGTGVLRVIRVDSGCVDHQADAAAYVGGALSDLDAGPFFGEPFGQGALFCIGAGDCETVLQQDLGQSAHADPPDADEMHVYGMVKVYLIHIMKISFLD